MTCIDPENPSNAYTLSSFNIYWSKRLIIYMKKYYLGTHFVFMMRSFHNVTCCLIAITLKEIIYTSTFMIAREFHAFDTCPQIMVTYSLPGTMVVTHLSIPLI